MVDALLARGPARSDVFAVQICASRIAWLLPIGRSLARLAPLPRARFADFQRSAAPMMSSNNGSHSARYDSPESQRPAGCPGSVATIVELLQSHLMDEARKGTILQAVAGGRFCAVMLDDGGLGVANLCPDECGVPSRLVSGFLPQPGTPATDALATLVSGERSAVGLATANALANRFAGEANESSWNATWHSTKRWREASVGKDLLDVLELRPDDHVGMVGCFSPMVDRIRQCVRRLSIFERGRRLTPDLLPEGQAAELLPKCTVALITATTMINGTINELLPAARDCREVVLLGPSTPLVPEVFDASSGRVTLLAGVVVTNAAELLHSVAQGGGTRDFKTSVAKVNVRVSAGGEDPSLA